MTLPRKESHLLLTPADLPPTQDDLRVVGVFNPGAIEHDGQVMLLVRVAEAPVEQVDRCRISPRWDGQRIVFDQFADFMDEDARVFRVDGGRVSRLTFTSHLRAIPLVDGTRVTPEAIAGASRFDPVGADERFGVEDPRITKIDGRYWITYVAVGDRGPCTALASTTNFHSFQRHGIIFPVENKDVVLFPEKISGKYRAMHRPMGGFAPPAIWMAASGDLIHWGEHQPLQLPAANWSAGRVGGGCPPIKTERGWLVIYHGNDKQAGSAKGNVGSYFGAAMLLDLEDPTRIIARSAEPFFRPELDFERNGFVPNVVFATGVVERGDELLIYYGAADEATAVAAWSTRAILDSLEPM